MKRSHLQNKFLNTKSEIDSKAYKKQCTYCATDIRKAKQTLIGNINTDVTDNKIFWRTVKPFFTDNVRLIQKLF